MDVGTGLILAMILGVIGSLTASYFSGSTKTVEPLEERIERLTSELQSSSKLAREIEDEISLRKKLVEDLRQDAEQYQKLVTLNQEQVGAITQVIQGQLEREGNKSFWKAAAVNFAFFLAGLIASYFLQRR